jgi:F-type H+-transporting ATPase subunit a
MRFELVSPELVSGPKILFSIPVPDHFPLSIVSESGQHAIPVTITVVTTWVIMALLLILFRWGTSNLQMNPGKKQAFFESLYGAYDGMVGQILGKWKSKYLVYISTLFTFLFVANITSFFPIPGIFKTADGWSIEYLLRPPTADLNTTLGLALLTTFLFLSAAFSTSGPWGYLKSLMDPIPVMLPLNIIGEAAKPVNISMRLFGNMFAGSIIIGLLYKAAPWGIPAPLHLYFDLFSGLIQSYVFTMLTMVYIQGKLEEA